MSPNSIVQKLVFVLDVHASDCLGYEMRTNRKNQPGKTNKMFAYIQFEREDDAMVVLVHWGNLEGLRVSFCKESLEEVKRTLIEKKIRTVSGDQTLS